MLMDFAAKDVETKSIQYCGNKSAHGGKHSIHWTTFVYWQCTERGSSTVLSMLHVNN